MNQEMIPPQAIDLEEAVLGAVIIEKDAIFDILDIIGSESFYKDSHQKIFAVMTHLANEFKPLDMLTVSDELRKRGQLEVIGGAFYLTQLASKIASSANIEYHARILSQKYLARELIKSSRDIISKGYDDSIDISDTLDHAYVSLDKLNNYTLSGQTKTFSENIQISLDDYEKRVENKKNNIQTFIPTGLGELNKIMIGWTPGLTILAARPSVGKTAVSLFFAKQAAKYGFPVDVFSLEMSAKKITNRMILGETKINPKDYNKGLDVNWDELEKATKKIKDYNIMINDEMDISINYIRSIIRKRFKQGKLGLVIIDYLQLMEGTDKSNKNNEVGSITRALKKLTQKYDFPIILLSQLSRDIEKRGNDRHKLSDLRDSGNIEQDADNVLFISRNRYDDEGGELDLSIEENRKVYIDVSKNREGSLGLVTCLCNEYVNNFYEENPFEDYKAFEGIDPDTNIESNRDFDKF